LSLNKAGWRQKNAHLKTDKWNSEYYEKALHNNGSWQSQRMYLAKNSLVQLGRQGTDRTNDIVTTTSSHVFGRLLIGVTSKPGTRSGTTRVFHGIYTIQHRKHQKKCAAERRTNRSIDYNNI
jgi:hypothetical protein